jgi:hypothetical protein
MRQSDPGAGHAAGPPEPPPWEAAAARAIGDAARLVRPIAASTPANFAAELERLRAAWDAGREEAPRFAYTPARPLGALGDALDELATGLELEGPLGALYAARARELAIEAAISDHAGRPGLWGAARRRYAPRDGFDAAADTLAATWLAGRDDAQLDPGPVVTTDDERDPRSLVARLRAEIGARRLPIRVAVIRDLASLAATGEGVVQVVAARSLTVRDVERTVLHELEGHALPRLRAEAARLGLFALGTARGSDDQEGRALHLERAAGFLDGPRRRELALRHLAARAVERGADFVDTARLCRAHGAPVADALRIAGRVHRGGGLGREAVYLPALLRVEDAIARDPAVDRVLASGKVAVGAAATLAPFAQAGRRTDD